MSTDTPPAAEALRGSNWGRWGESDERGTLNLITDEKRLADLGTPRTGRVFSLGKELLRQPSSVGDYRTPFQRTTLASQSDEAFWEAMAERMGTPAPGTGANEDVVITPTHNGTHMDALCHVYDDGSLYNGFPRESFTSLGGAQRNSIHRVGGIVGRGVLLDVATYLGVDWLEPSFHIESALLEEVRAAQGTRIRPGDVVLIRTGHGEAVAYAKKMGEEPPRMQPGLGLASMDFFDACEPAAVGADNSAVECIPCEERFLSVHVQLIVRRGIHLIENLDLSELAAANCRDFFFVAAPLKIVGGTGSPINPIAIG
ncbi:cyclase family protein [Microbacterium sp.]|uniref:cyclase family protein n=1 Tax=Microbacterium sp. TaxID=51671 RepID=UPI00273300F6|nr:cyclase family protein [Microbacterium sp.]MDP3950434.1 cyclase family protein [Microbacterium sp.]